MKKTLNWLAFAVAIVVFLFIVGFGLLQTRAGKAFVAAAIARAASSPNSVWAIEGLGGFVPFDMSIRSITLSDPDGVWLTIKDVRLDLDPAALLRGELGLRLVSAAQVYKARSAAGPVQPLVEYFRVPHLPIALVVARLEIDQLVLGPAILGARIVATVAGDLAVQGGTARAHLDIHRIDGSAGEIGLQLTLSGAKPRLGLRFDATDPTGFVDDRIFGRADHLPLALSIDGDGPIADWHGRLTASAGSRARLDALVGLAVSNSTSVGLSAHVAAASLLPPDLVPLLGDNAKLSLHATFGQEIVVDRLSLAAAFGSLVGKGAYGGPSGSVAVDLRADLPELSKLEPITGRDLGGSAVVTAKVSGSKARPAIKADITASGVKASGAAARSVAAEVAVTPTGALDAQPTRFAIDAHGQFAGLALPKGLATKGGALAARIGEKITWSLAATADRDPRTADLVSFDVNGGGIDLKASGHVAVAAHGVAGMIAVSGSATGLRTGIEPADALLGANPSFTVRLRRDEAGVLTADDLVLTGAAARLTGAARLASNAVTASLAVDIPHLEPLRAAVGADIAGSLSAKATAQGPLDRLQLRTEIDGHRIALRGAAIDRLRISADVADLSNPKAIVDGDFRAGRLDGRLGFVAAPIGNTGLSVTQLRLTAADSAIAGNIRIGFADALVDGALTARLPDLSRWSTLTGKPLGGGLDLTASARAAGGGQDLDLTLNGARLAVGAGASAATIGRLAATARLADIRRRPTGTGRVILNSVHSGPIDFSTATAMVESRGAGRLAFHGDAAGHPLSFAFAGEGGFVPGGAELRLARLTGSLDTENFMLEQPLDLTSRGPDLLLPRLALRFGSGRITGGGSVRGQALVFSVNAANLPIAAGARLIGRPGMHGELSLAGSLSGSLRAPSGHFTVSATNLALATSPEVKTPRLGLTVAGDWNGRSVDLRGQVTGLHGDRMALAGSLPLVLNPSPLGISIPPQGRLALNLQGGGDIGHLGEILPLGEDRVSGKFGINASVGGTIAAPSAGGRLTLTDARYENFATGAVLTNLDAELVGSGDHFQLASLSAGDGSGGSLKAQGSLTLSGTGGPAAQLSATLAKFRVAASDEATATASGTVAVTGPLTAPKIAARLTIDRAEINLPSSLPPNVVVIQVTKINGKEGAPLRAAPSAPMLAAPLEITVVLPGPVLVRGHGLDSDWHGHLTISGTTAAPKIAGALIATRGNVDLLGKSFRLTRGAITFDGTAKLDPAVDIVAEVSASNITAQVVINGFASAPKVSLTSTPQVPQDEILSRILFNQGVGQLTAAQGAQLAAAAATLAGGGPGVIDQLRGKLGLDWLSFGQGPTGAASSILNPSVVTPTTKSTAAVSAGKYIAPGVSIGVTQGVSPPTSKVTVQVDVGHHLTVDTEAGQNGGTGIGLGYNYDY
jgi:translocation and assembly module TamB